MKLDTDRPLLFLLFFFCLSTPVLVRPVAHRDWFVLQQPQTFSLATYKAEKAKKDKEFEASLGIAPVAEAREIKSSWYKPEQKVAAAPKASSSSSVAPKEVKQQKNFVPISQILGEFRGEDRRGPRRDGGERREGGDRQFKPRDGPRQGGRGGNPRGAKKDRPTFDATANTDKLPSLH